MNVGGGGGNEQRGAELMNHLCVTVEGPAVRTKARIQNDQLDLFIIAVFLSHTHTDTRLDFSAQTR